MSEQETPQEQPKILFGFGVFFTEQGSLFLERNKDIFKVPIEREATLIEIRRHLSEILMDLQAQAAAEYTALRVAQRPDPIKE